MFIKVTGVQLSLETQLLNVPLLGSVGAVVDSRGSHGLRCSL